MNSVKASGLTLPSAATGKTGAAGAKGLAASHAPELSESPEDAFRDALEKALAPGTAQPAGEAGSGTAGAGSEGSKPADGKPGSLLSALSASDLPSLIESSKAPAGDSRAEQKPTAKTAAAAPQVPVSATLPLPDTSHNAPPRQGPSSEGVKHAPAESPPAQRAPTQESVKAGTSSGASAGGSGGAPGAGVSLAGLSLQAIGEPSAPAKSFAAALDSSDLQPLLEQAQGDASLRLNISAQSAQLSLDAGQSGALFAQLHIVNGVADVRIGGEGASDLARHGAELSLGLTAVGLQPGRLEISASGSADSHGLGADGQGNGNSQPESGGEGGKDGSQSRSQRPEPLDAAPAVSSPAFRSGGVHVKA